MSSETGQPIAGPSNGGRIRTGTCIIDLEARSVIRDGEAVVVEAKVFDLMAVLLRNNERTMSKRELGDILWPDRAVTDAALSQLLRKARRALGDDGETQGFIRTVHGHGLQWVAALSIEDAPAPIHTASDEAPETAADSATGAPADLSRRRRFLILAIALVLVLLVGLSLWWTMRSAVEPGAQNLPVKIVLLPTRDHSGEAELAWTSKGLAGLMSSLLQNQPDVEVIAAPDFAVTEPAGTDRLDKRFRALGASHAVSSELRKLGSIYEFEYVLRSLDTGREIREVLRGNSPAALAADAVARLQSRLRNAAESGSVAVGVGIDDAFVAEVYARGLDAQLRGDHGAAMKYFAICLDHDPGLLWPRLQLTRAQVAAGEIAQATENAQQIVDAAATKGLFVMHAQALRLLASMAFVRGDLDSSEQMIQTAMAELPPASQEPLRVDLMVASASILSERGERKESRQLFDRALLLARGAGDRRGEASVLVNLAVVDNAEGDIAATLSHLREALDAARAAGDGGLELDTLLNLGGAEFNAGHPLAAAVLLRQSLVLAKQRSDRRVQVFSAVMLSSVLVAFDHTEPAAALATAVLALGEREENRYWQAEAHWALSAIAGHRGHWAQAMTELDLARDLFAKLGLHQRVGQVLADSVQMGVRSGDLKRAGLAAEAYRSEASADPKNKELNARLPLIDAQMRYLQGDREEALRALTAFVTSRAADRGPATLAALIELGRWQIELGAADALLAEPVWTTWLNELPEALVLRIEALRAGGQRAAADREQQRLDGMRQSKALIIDRVLLQIP